MIGGESEKRFYFLITQFTSIRSPEMIQALRQHYVEGITEEIIKITVDNGNFNRANKRLVQAAINVEKIKEMDWVKFGYKSNVNE